MMTVKEFIKVLQALSDEAQNAIIVKESYADNDSSVPEQTELSDADFYPNGSYPTREAVVVV